MAGVPYPREPATGSNGLGLFEIGISPIGTIPPFDVWQTVISQYANSPILTTLVSNVFDYLDQTENFDNFYDDIWNVDTATGYGLDVWGRIVGINRALEISAVNWFGFEEGLPSYTGFNQGPFFSGNVINNTFLLTDLSYRNLILAKAAANITNGSIQAINQILLLLFPGRGNCYVTDGGDMTMTYTFSFALSPVELAIVQTSGVLPTPTGVKATVVTP